MADKVYILSEAAKRAGISEAQLDALVKEKIIKPSVVADEKEMLFDESDILQLEGIARLMEVGYLLSDIKKIVKKVGLPERARQSKRGGKPSRYLTVGELARKTGINGRTIKYWEEREIIAPTKRTEGGFRLYHDSYVLFCNLIRDLQLFGYALEEIKEVADLFRLFYALKTEQDTGLSRKEIGEKLEEMTSKIGSLEARMKQLGEGIERWKKLTKEKQEEIKGLKKLYSQKSGEKKSLKAEKAAKESSS
ncbi:MAG: hypothetical protein Kow0090_15040 [Myxococcota bacterium]